MISLLLAFAVIRVAVVPPEARPAFVKSVIEAIAAKDAGRIASSFSEIVEDADGASRPITARRAVEMLSVCSQKNVSSLNAHVYVVAFECSSSQLAAKSCDSGKLNLIVDGDRRSFVISRGRKTSKSCPPTVPVVHVVNH
jgi:hypothetical protein